MTQTNATKRDRTDTRAAQADTSPARRSGSIPVPAAEFNQALFRRVQAFRGAAGLTQAQVAEAFGIPLRSYQHFERRSPLPAYLMDPFAKLVGVDFYDLLHAPRSTREETLHVENVSAGITWHKARGTGAYERALEMSTAGARRKSPAQRRREKSIARTAI